MIPNYERFFLPTLQAIEGGASDVAGVAEASAQRLELAPRDRAEVIAYDGTPVHVARTREALRDLRRAGLVTEDAAGRFRLTDSGTRLLAQGREVTREALGAYPAYVTYRERYLARRGA